MKFLNTLATLFMFAIIAGLYVLFFHHKHIHPIGSLANEIDEKMRCSKLIPLFREYENNHEQARFTDRHLTDAGASVSRFDPTYALYMYDEGMFGNPVLTVYCDSNERVIKYTLEAE